jgi:Dyp-type peroxidase family
MPVDLNKPLAWKAATGDAAAMLQQLQPNIVKAHVRDHLQVLLIQFADKAEGRAFVKAVGGKVKSAKKHLEEVEAMKTSGTPGTPYVGIGLTSAGYTKLGIATNKIPGNADPDAAPFIASMRSDTSVATLDDPPVKEWEAPYRHTIHAVVLIGDASKSAVATKRTEIDALITPKVKLLGEEAGLSQRNSRGDGIEHFGYIDGRSNPLFLVEDIADEKHTRDGATVWNPAFGLGRVLVSDIAAPDPKVDFGSFFVLRKLEQNVRKFDQAEKDLADALGLTGADRKRAGATIVGRFRDGTPLTTQFAAGDHNPVPNDFNYESDDLAGKCPFHGHVRKTNPRGSGGFEKPPDERKHLMPRRGQTFGARTDDPSDEKVPIASRPTGGVGLLFMAFNSQIGVQFQFTQATWANNGGFPNTSGAPGAHAPGLDQVIGQGTRPKADCPLTWGSGKNKFVNAAPQAVTMKGGEYFFMPSIAFLKSL